MLFKHCRSLINNDRPEVRMHRWRPVLTISHRMRRAPLLTLLLHWLAPTAHSTHDYYWDNEAGKRVKMPAHDLPAVQTSSLTIDAVTEMIDKTNY